MTDFVFLFKHFQCKEVTRIKPQSIYTTYKQQISAIAASKFQISNFPQEIKLKASTLYCISNEKKAFYSTVTPKK